MNKTPITEEQLSEIMIMTDEIARGLTEKQIVANIKKRKLQREQGIAESEINAQWNSGKHEGAQLLMKNFLSQFK
jgi:hypothetical protein